MARAHNQVVSRGEQNGKAKLTADQIRQIRASKEMHKVIAWRFGISQSHVNDIRGGRVWRHVQPVSSAAQGAEGAMNSLRVG